MDKIFSKNNKLHLAMKSIDNERNSNTEKETKTFYDKKKNETFATFQIE